MIDPISWAYSWPYILAAFTAAYLLGSIPFGLILTNLSGVGDLRKIGSGNIGATNVLRTGNKKLATATLLLDGAKGAVAVLIAKLFGPDIAIVAASGAFLGHLFPIWLKFRGGKGVATALGILLALCTPVGVLACGSWLLATGVLRYSSLSALVTMAAVPFYMWHLADPQRAEFSAMMGVLIWIRHWKNISRLVQGVEPRINFRHKK